MACVIGNSCNLITHVQAPFYQGNLEHGLQQRVAATLNKYDEGPPSVLLLDRLLRVPGYSCFENENPFPAVDRLTAATDHGDQFACLQNKKTTAVFKRKLYIEYIDYKALRYTLDVSAE